MSFTSISIASISFIITKKASVSITSKRAISASITNSITSTSITSSITSNSITCITIAITAKVKESI